MAIYYSEFDTTNQNLMVDLRAAIVANTDWTFQGYNTSLISTSAVAAAGATALTFTSGTIPAAIVVGSRIRIDTYASGVAEYRDVTAKTATTLTVAALSNAHASGANIFWGAEVFKTTTVRGADMFLDLSGAAYPTWMRLGVRALNTYTSPTGTADGTYTGGAAERYIYWRRNVGAATNPVHVTLSTSKDHFFVSIEGPRASETNPTSATYGSPRNYFFMSDVVPYSVGDTTPVFAVGGGNISDSTVTTVGSFSTIRNYLINTSKNITNTGFFPEGKLLTLAVPDMNGGLMVGAQRYTQLDSEYYMSPFVVASDEAGFRGRLSSFFFAGYNTASNVDGVYPMVGSRVTYNSVTYEFQAVSKGSSDAFNDWGPFGIVNNNGTTFFYSPVVAIPVA